MNKNEIKANKEYLEPIEFRNLSEDDMKLSGYAVTFNQPTVLYKIGGLEFKEVIDRNAFVGTDMKDCCLKYNHDGSFPILARTRGESLKIKTDDYGLYFDAKLFDTQSARDIYTLVKGGALDKCSFAFTIAEGGDLYDPKTRTRTITKFEKLWDLSVVDVPSYNSTSVSARSFFEAEAEKELMEMRELELRKKKIMLLLELSGKESR